MELSLFSRDTIAMGTAIALTHDVFDAALLLGICDKIVPGLLIGALHFGHLPCVFVPGGPMTSGLSNSEKTKVREQYAQGQVGRDELLAAESAAYHGAGTCTFYGTANSNQMLLEAMGLHVPGAAFVHPARRAARGADARGGAHGAGQRRLGRGGGGSERGSRRSAGWSTSACIVNAMVALLATGGSTNHLIHWVAVARAAGIVIDWTDFSDLSHAHAAAGARLPERQRRREPVPGRRRARLRDPRAARRRLPARRRASPSPPAACADYTRVPERRGRRASPGRRCRRRAATTPSCARRRSRSARTAA